MDQSQKQPFRNRLAMYCFQFGIRAITWIMAKISGDLSAIIPQLMSSANSYVQPPMRARAVENGRARDMSALEELIQQFARSIPPDSQWVHHEAEWQGYRVVVMPRVIDSNTGVVIGPKDSPELGSVVTNDGQAPNCDPPALNFILNGPGPVPPTRMDAEFLDGPDAA